MTKQRIYQAREIPAFETAYTAARSAAGATQAAAIEAIKNLPDDEYDAAYEIITAAWRDEMAVANAAYKLAFSAAQ